MKWIKNNMDILTGEYCSSIQVAKMDIIYWSIGTSSSRRGDTIKEVEVGVVYLF